VRQQRRRARPPDEARPELIREAGMPTTFVLALIVPLSALMPVQSRLAMPDNALRPNLKLLPSRARKLALMDATTLSALPQLHAMPVSRACVAMQGDDGQTTPEQLLLAAIGHLKGGDVPSARSDVEAARRLCEANGGPTDEQAQLLGLLSSRLPPPVSETPEPTLAGMYPGTTAAPTGKSLVMPGTPSMAELAAKAKARREAAIRKAQEEKGQQ